jgi:hypothetical protein
MAVAWIALKPRVLRTVPDAQELSEPSNQPSTYALNGLPATYGGVPKLGPPRRGNLDDRSSSASAGWHRKTVWCAIHRHNRALLRWANRLSRAAKDHAMLFQK